MYNKDYFFSRINPDVDIFFLEILLNSNHSVTIISFYWIYFIKLNWIQKNTFLYNMVDLSYFVLATSSIIFAAAFSTEMLQRIAFGGSYSRMFTVNIEDVGKIEFTLLYTLVIPAVILGIYTAPVLDGLNYGVSTLIYSYDSDGFSINCDAPMAWAHVIQNCGSMQMDTIVDWVKEIITYFNGEGEQPSGGNEPTPVYPSNSEPGYCPDIRRS